MNTQVVFKIDKKLKDSAMTKARNQGVSLSTVLEEATRSPEIPNARTARSLKIALNDAKLGRNFSPAFDNAEDAVAYLKKYAS